MRTQHFLTGIILLSTSCQSQTNAVPIQTPITTIKTIDARDSTYFSLTLLKDGVDAAIFQKKEHLKDSAAIENFIQSNQSLINSNKILIIGEAKTSYNNFKTIMAILKRRNYLKFQMIAK
jgi:biopolymer transport protein ExbD